MATRFWNLNWWSALLYDNFQFFISIFYSTHSRCACQRLATFALLAPPADKNYNLLNGPNSSEAAEQNDILVGIMAAIILVLAIVVVAILACYCRKRKVSFLIKKNLGGSTYIRLNNGGTFIPEPSESI